jgi:hypothetical protein
MFASDTEPKLEGQTLNTDELLTHLPFPKETLDNKEIARARLTDVRPRRL